MKLALVTASIAALALSACGEAPTPEPDYASTDVSADLIAEIKNPNSARFDSTLVERVGAAIAAEPTVKGVAFDERIQPEWKVLVTDDGTKRYGFAEYICTVLRAEELVDDKVAVGIINAKDRSQSLGTVRCSDQQRLD